MSGMRSIVALVMCAVISPRTTQLHNNSHNATSEAALIYTEAISPPLDSAHFHPKNFDESGELATLHAADAARVKHTKGPRQAPRLPDQIEELLRRTSDVDHAIRVLSRELGWKPSAQTLKSYMGRYGITAPWKYAYWMDCTAGRRRRPRVDPRLVQRVMNSRPNEEAMLEWLKEQKQFLWSPSLAEFRKFRKKYRLQLPPHWPYARQVPRRSVPSAQAA